MSRGVETVQQHVEHKLGHGGGVSRLEKMVALLIAVTALFLAFSETLGKSAQTAALSHQIVSSNMWDLFQAHKNREAQYRIAADELRLALAGTTDAKQKSEVQAKIDEWTARADRYRSEPETGEGTDELRPRAEAEVELSHAKLIEYHHYELASAAFQIGIVLVSALVLIGLTRWCFPTGGFLLAIGLALMGLALLNPHLLPLH